jgi:sec-independent protein translocase protein TatA
MGPIGVQEMIFIFLLALVLFGPKKLPELGRMVGKALSEFRRAQSELKATFDREMRNLELETQSKEVTPSYQSDSYNYDYTSNDSEAYHDPYEAIVAETSDSAVTETSIDSASATEGAESKPAVIPEGAIAHETGAASAGNGQAAHENSEPHPAASSVTTAEPNA